MTRSHEPVEEAASVRLLDVFEVRCRGVVVEIPPGCQRLVALLALSTSPLRRAFVAGRLWADHGETRTQARLRSALWRVRSSGAPIIDVSSTQLGLRRDVLVDIRRQVSAARAFLSGTAPAEPFAWRDVLEGDLLPDWYEDWVLLERERLRQLRLHALEAVALQLTRHGRHGEAVEAAQAAVCTDPLRETAQRALIAAYLGEENVAEALAQYSRYERLLRRRVGIEPSPHLAALVSRSTTAAGS